MLREQVLSSWQSCQEKILAQQKYQLTKPQSEFFELLATNLMNVPPLKEHILAVNINNLKRRTTFLVKEYEETKQEFLKMSPSPDDDSVAAHLDLTYLAYSGICQMYQQFVQALDNSNSGPTIEEVP